MRVALFTIGCMVNQYETEAVAKKLEALGFERVDFREKADVYLLNTYTVSEKATGFAYRGAKPELVQLLYGCLLHTPLPAFDRHRLQRVPPAGVLAADFCSKFPVGQKMQFLQ
ncbi:MAG: hypothetical protein WBF13_10735 [Candidatus Zixiibacteriota bacterium]